MQSFIIKFIMTSNIIFRASSKAVGITKIKLLAPSKRNLNLHENVSMKLLRDNGVNVPEFGVAKTPQDVTKIIKNLKSKEFMVKAQVLAGGRGKGHFDSGLKGGVKKASSEKEAIELTSGMLGHRLITKQTDDKGIVCNQVMIAECIDLKRESFIAIMLQPSINPVGPVILGRSVGGVNIEEDAEKNPDLMIKELVDYGSGVTTEQARRIAEKLGFSKDSIEDASKMVLQLYKTFMKFDSLSIEINPFVEDASGKVLCLDAKIRIDDNAKYRQKELFETQDWSQSDPREREAAKYDLNYIALDGNIGCLVNGAGLAMATMDLIKLHGGDPANFLDIGGGATVEQVTQAFRIITSDPKVNVILINIFGGIMRCDIIAKGIIEAVSNLDLKIPIVCRLQGTAAKEAEVLLHSSNFTNVKFSDDFVESAKLAISLAAQYESSLKHKS